MESILSMTDLRILLAFFMTSYSELRWVAVTSLDAC